MFRTNTQTYSYVPRASPSGIKLSLYKFEWVVALYCWLARSVSPLYQARWAGGRAATRQLSSAILAAADSSVCSI